MAVTRAWGGNGPKASADSAKDSGAQYEKTAELTAGPRSLSVVRGHRVRAATLCHNTSQLIRTDGTLGLPSQFEFVEYQ
jgi:hypothetical protein